MRYMGGGAFDSVAQLLRDSVRALVAGEGAAVAAAGASNLQLHPHLPHGASAVSIEVLSSDPTPQHYALVISEPLSVVILVLSKLTHIERGVMLLCRSLNGADPVATCRANMRWAAQVIVDARCWDMTSRLDTR